MAKLCKMADVHKSSKMNSAVINGNKNGSENAGGYLNLLLAH